MIVALLLAAAVQAEPTDLAKSMLSYPGYPASQMSTTVLARTPRFALIRFLNGKIEGEIISGYLLAQRFSFGWQLVDFGERKFRLCDLRARAATKAEVETMRHWLRPGEPSKMEGGCGFAGRDVGPEKDIAAVRKFPQPTQLVPSVRVAGGFALLQWTLPGGGMTLYKRSSDGWSVVTGGGGALARSDLLRYGIPPNIARVLLDY
jgi:hypothetical protein